MHIQKFIKFQLMDRNWALVRTGFAAPCNILALVYFLPRSGPYRVCAKWLATNHPLWARAQAGAAPAAIAGAGAAAGLMGVRVARSI